MPLPQNVNAILGAGVFGIVCAATLYMVEHFRQDRRRHAMAKDLARLNTEFAALRQELDNLLAQQKKYFYNGVQFQQIDLWHFSKDANAPKRKKRGRRAESFISSSTATEDYSSAVDGDSSELEFYDLSDEDVEATNLEADLDRIDKILDDGSIAALESCIEQLQNLCIESPENPQLLWRLGKAHYQLFSKTEQQEHLTKGIEACKTALNYTPELANVHKWLAILLGERAQFQPIKDKITDGNLFKQHVDAAIKLDPSDSTLHHMLGRFAYDVADLKWYERKVAAALFAEPPSATHEEALEHFLEAERLSENVWKQNMVYIAKCRIKLGDVEEAVRVLEKAAEIETENGADEPLDLEIKELLKKHRT